MNFKKEILTFDGSSIQMRLYYIINGFLYSLMLNRINILIFFILYILLNCAHQQSSSEYVSEKIKKTGFSEFYLIVSDKHAEDFTAITKRIYGESEIEPLFSSLKFDGDAYCSMRRKIASYDIALAEKFLNPDIVQKYFNSYPGSLEDLVAGCWNFFEMNDLRPDLDFVLVKKLYPDYDYDCYSVGFLQPYIMQNVLSCRFLSMVDINWRILDAHNVFIKNFQKNRNAQSAVQNTEFSWFALDKMNLKKKGGSVNILCRDVQQKSCEEYLNDFDRTLIFPQKISLQLTHLYKTEFNRTDANVLKVFFLSNAIEEAYTSKKEFEELMQRTSDVLMPGQKTLFIHHVGGWKLFGIYELEKTESSYRLKTVCRDEYRSLNRSKNGIPVIYRTHFENLSEDRTAPPSCGSKL